MPDVDISTAAADERGVIANLMQLYVHDFSEQWWDRPEDGELERDGRFGEYDLAPYWREADCVPLLFRRAGRPIGFALLNAASHSGEPVDRNMAEFFVARKHRRSGAGLFAAQALFTRYPGQWEAAVARRNIGALAFWRRAVATQPGVSEVAETDTTSAAWNGIILRFRS